MARTKKLPPFDAEGDLPPGKHWIDWETFQAKYFRTKLRREKLAGLKLAIADLKAAGCRILYIDGGFVTSKPDPKDFDACWDPEGVNEGLLHPALRDCVWPRDKQMDRYKGELFNMYDIAIDNEQYIDFLQQYWGKPKGIIAIDIRRIKL